MSFVSSEEMERTVRKMVIRDGLEAKLGVQVDDIVTVIMYLIALGLDKFGKEPEKWILN